METKQDTQPKDDEIKATFAKVELMGHVTIAGRLSEEEKFGVKLGRLDVPNADGTWTTVWFGGAGVYRITAVTEAVARDIARRTGAAPVSAWDYPRAAIPALTDRSGDELVEVARPGDEDDDQDDQDDCGF